MQLSDAFKELIKRIAQVLKEQDFSRRGQTFYCFKEGNWKVINFQKSMKSNTKEVIFTVNLGIASGRLLRFFSPPALRAITEARPTEYDCHWRKRLGSLFPSNEDRWWTIKAETPLEQLTQEIQGYLYELVLPTLEIYSKDEALRDIWLSGLSPGLTNFQRLLNLVVLLKTLGPQDLLAPALKELQSISEGTPRCFIVEDLIQRLEQEEPE